MILPLLLKHVLIEKGDEYFIAEKTGAFQMQVSL